MGGESRSQTASPVVWRHRSGVLRRPNIRGTAALGYFARFGLPGPADFPRDDPDARGFRTAGSFAPACGRRIANTAASTTPPAPIAIHNGRTPQPPLTQNTVSRASAAVSNTHIAAKTMTTDKPNRMRMPASYPTRDGVGQWRPPAAAFSRSNREPPGKTDRRPVVPVFPFSVRATGSNSPPRARAIRSKRVRPGKTAAPRGRYLAWHAAPAA